MEMIKTKQGATQDSHMPETMLTISVNYALNHHTQKETQGKESPKIVSRCVQHEQRSPENDVDALDAFNDYFLTDEQHPYQDTWPISISGKCTQ